MAIRRRGLCDSIVGNDIVVVQCGYIDTTHGFIMTTTQALRLRLAEENTIADRAKKMQAEEMRVVMELKEARDQTRNMRPLLEYATTGLSDCFFGKYGCPQVPRWRMQCG